MVEWKIVAGEMNIGTPLDITLHCHIYIPIIIVTGKMNKVKDRRDC